MSLVVPKIIFIIPYRDRENQKSLFIRQMTYVLEDMPKTDYLIYFSEQCDTRDFNRGAMRNIGFLAMKQKFPNDYKNITFVFNDVDTFPYRKNYLNYQTTENTVKHFYGYEHALGGIVSILGSDFEKIEGYPNFWTWGYEDNSLQKRIIKNNISINREQFHKVSNNEIVQLIDNIYKKTNRKEFEQFMENTEDGLSSLSDIDFIIDEDNLTIKINNFNTKYVLDESANNIYDITSHIKPYEYFKGRRRTAMPMFRF